MWKTARLGGDYGDVILGGLIFSSVQKPGRVKMPNTYVLKSSVTSHVVLFTKATWWISPGAHFTLWFGTGIRGDLTQNNNNHKKIQIKPSFSAPPHRPLRLLSLASSLVPRAVEGCGPGWVRSIVIALQGNLAAHQWKLSIVERLSCELPGQLCGKQRCIFWNHSLWLFIMLMIVHMQLNSCHFSAEKFQL